MYTIHTIWPDKHGRVVRYPVKCATSVHWSSHVLQGTRNTRSRITGHHVISYGKEHSAYYEP